MANAPSLRIIIVLAVLSAAGWACTARRYPQVAPQGSINTNRANVHVVDTLGGRAMLINGRIKEFVDAADGASQLRYAAVLELPMHYFLEPGKALLLGSGSGGIVRRYRQRGWSVEVVEPESLLLQAARSSFGMPGDSGGATVVLHNDDGRYFLEAAGGPLYDIILEDAVTTIPHRPHLLTKEFFQLAARRLRREGMVGVALECSGWDDPAVQSLGATLGAVFGHVIVLPIAEPPNRFGPIVLLGSGRQLEALLQDPNRNVGLEPDWRYSPDYQKTHAWDNHFAPKAGTVQTDGENSWEDFFARLDDPARKDSADYLP